MSKISLFAGSSFIAPLLLWSSLLAPLGYAPAVQAREHRSRAVLHAFEKTHPCPSTGQPRGACPGYIMDHVIALCDGGPDAVSNLQWQTIDEAKAKDRTECRHRPPSIGGND